MCILGNTIQHSRKNIKEMLEKPWTHALSMEGHCTKSLNNIC